MTPDDRIALTAHVATLDRSRGAALAYATQGRHEDAYLVLVHVRSGLIPGLKAIDREPLDIAAITQFVLYALDTALEPHGLTPALFRHTTEAYEILYGFGGGQGAGGAGQEYGAAM